MKHQRIEDISAGATIAPLETKTLSRRERLERWAELLERDPRKRLTALRRVEFVPAAERDAIRDDDTPISVAFADPALRAAGLEGDTLGDARRFFELSHEEAHHLLCDCHYFGRMDGETVANRVRGAMRPPLAQRIFGRS